MHSSGLQGLSRQTMKQNISVSPAAATSEMAAGLSVGGSEKLPRGAEDSPGSS